MKNESLANPSDPRRAWHRRDRSLPWLIAGALLPAGLVIVLMPTLFVWGAFGFAKQTMFVSISPDGGFQSDRYKTDVFSGQRLPGPVN
jgi:hypothetical protein